MNYKYRKFIIGFYEYNGKKYDNIEYSDHNLDMVEGGTFTIRVKEK